MKNKFAVPTVEVSDGRGGTMIVNADQADQYEPKAAPKPKAKAKAKPKAKSE